MRRQQTGMVAGLKSGGASPPPQSINPSSCQTFPVRAKFFRLYFAFTSTAGMALNSAMVSGVESPSPSTRNDE